MTTQLVRISADDKEKQFLYYRSLIKQLIYKKAETELAADQTIKKLELEIPIYVEHVENLDVEVKKLKSKIKPEKSENQEENIQDIPENLDDKAEIKQLFKIIASKCHPDKTDDEELHDIFKIAKDAYKKQNIFLMYSVYESFTAGTKEVFNIDKKLEISKAEYLKLKEEYDRFLKTNRYIIHKLFTSQLSRDKFYSRKIFLDLILNRILDLEDLKSSLEDQIKKAE